MQRAEEKDLYGPPLLGSLGHLPSKARYIAKKILKLHDLDCDELAKWIQGRFEKGIIETYRQILGNMLVDSDGREKLAFRIQGDKSSSSCWFSSEPGNKMDPSWNNLFLGLAAFDINVGPSIPRGRDVVIESLAKTLSDIRSEKLGEMAKPVDRGTLACLHYTRYSKWWILACETEEAEHWKLAMFEVRPYITQRAPQVLCRDKNDIRQRMLGWIKPWYLLHLVMPLDWQYEEKDETRPT